MNMPNRGLPENDDRQLPVPFVHNHLQIHLEADTQYNINIWLVLSGGAWQTSKWMA
jgi:hypothetical protein